MEVTVEQLRSRYELWQTEDLLALLAGGDLTQEAEFILMTELRARGYGDRDSAVEAGGVVVEAKREAKGRVGSWLSGHFASLIVGVLLCGVFVCVSVLAPFIWRSPADRVCQEAGYWYATGTGLTEVYCFGWRPSEEWRLLLAEE
jgi:hypothetical protein